MPIALDKPANQDADFVGGPTTALAGWMDAIGDNPTPETVPPSKTTEPPAKGTEGTEKPTGGTQKTTEPPVDAKPPAEPKTEEKPPEKPAKEVVDDDERYPRDKKDWDKYKTKNAERQKALQAEIDAREKRIADLEKTAAEFESKLKANQKPPEANPEIEQQKKLIEELSSRIMELDVTADPRFVNYFATKTNAQIELAKRIVGDERGEALAKALQLPDSEDYKDLKNAQIEEAIAELNPLQQARIGAVLNNLAEIESERQSEMAKAKEHKSAIEIKREQTRKETLANRERIFSEVVKKMGDEKEGNPLFQKRANDEAWNKGVDERIARSKQLLSGEGITPDEVVMASMYAVAFPTVLQAYQADMAKRDAEITKLQAQVKSMQAAQPKGGTTSEGGGTDNGTTTKPGMSPFEVSSAWARSMTEGMKSVGQE